MDSSSQTMSYKELLGQADSLLYEAKELGVHYFACGHHATERYGVQRLAQAIADQFAIETVYFELNNPI